MIIIAHRGITEEDEPFEGISYENSPDIATQNFLINGFAIELDVQDVDVISGTFSFGHDSVVHKEKFLDRFDDSSTLKGIFFHAKTPYALENLLEIRDMYDYDFDVFSHEDDPRVVTRNGYIWNYPGKGYAGPRSILVMPEWNDFVEVKPGYYGYCTDYPLKVRKMLQEQMK